MPTISPIRGVRHGRTELNALRPVVGLDADLDAGLDIEPDALTERVSVFCREDKGLGHKLVTMAWALLPGIVIGVAASH